MHKVIAVGASIVAMMLLWQVRKLHPLLSGVMVLLILGILLRYYTTIEGQFKNLGAGNTSHSGAPNGVNQHQVNISTKFKNGFNF